MSTAPDPCVFFQVSSKDAKSAFAFHESLSSDGHIFARSEKQIQEFATDGELFAVRRASTREYVGLCYVHFDEEKNEWELGGLTVPESTRRFRLGSVLSYFALAHTIAYQRPWTYGQAIIAHVHEANVKPRNLLQRIGFEHVKRETFSGEDLPPSLARNADGNVVGDKFLFPKEKIASLVNWFDVEFNGTLGDGVTQAIFEVPPAGLESLKEALREAAKEFSL